MKSKFFLAVLIWSITSCNSNKVSILGKAYIGMSRDEYGKVFTDHYELPIRARKIDGKLNPRFTDGLLSSLEISVDDIADFDTAYNVYELGNHLCYQYGTPVENKETIWAGGTSRYYRWSTGLLQVEYRFIYNQVQGTSGLLYTGNARMTFNSTNSAD